MVGVVCGQIYGALATCVTVAVRSPFFPSSGGQTEAWQLKRISIAGRLCWRLDSWVERRLAQLRTGGVVPGSRVSLRRDLGGNCRPVATLHSGDQCAGGRVVGGRRFPGGGARPARNQSTRQMVVGPLNRGASPEGNTGGGGLDEGVETGELYLENVKQEFQVGADSGSARAASGQAAPWLTAGCRCRTPTGPGRGTVAGRESREIQFTQGWADKV